VDKNLRSISRRKPRAHLAGSAVKYLVINIIAILWLIPVYSMIINGFKSDLAVTSTPVLVPPRTPTAGPYLAVVGPLARPILNSLIVAVSGSVIATILGTMGAYFFYSLSTSWRRTLTVLSDAVFAIIAMGTFIPYQSTIIPLTRLIVSLNGLDTFSGLIIAMLVFYVPTAALLMSIFLAVIPRSVVEAARIDSASELKILFRVVLPLAFPGFISTLIFVLIQTWNNFFIPLVLTTTPNMRLVPVAVQAYTGGYGTLYNESFAVAVLGSLVPLVIFIFLGRYFIRGLMALGAGKGV
jgi:glucose/arabinose transport system permease protein